MLSESFIKFYSDAIDAAVNELSQYQSESDIWKVPAGINNSAGNLALHLAGNLKYFFGTVLGNTGYVRERDKEFSEKNIAREILIRQLQEAKEIVLSVIRKSGDSILSDLYPENERHQGGSIGNQYIRLLAHLNYHLGQMNYHRRLVK